MTIDLIISDLFAINAAVCLVTQKNILPSFNSLSTPNHVLLMGIDLIIYDVFTVNTIGLTNNYFDVNELIYSKSFCEVNIFIDNGRINIFTGYNQDTGF